MEERWMLRTKRADFQAIGQRYGIDPVLARIIRNRDVEGWDAIDHYLYGTVEDLYDPLLMKGMKETADLVEASISRGEGITVASDFDDDGIFASMILWTAIRRLGGKVVIDTPDRVREGYGLNRRIVEQAHARGDGMILTCDNGIAAFEPIAYARELGMTVAVTDHHEVLYEDQADGSRVYQYPPANTIVDPRQPECTYPFPKLCGAGVAWKLVQVLYDRQGIEKEELYVLLEYAAIATVADVMDLVEENRIIVREGLRRLGSTENKGLRALIKACGLEGKKLTAYHIGFIIGPCFNAAGRLETVKLALELLTETMEGAAEQKAMRLKELNDSRKDMTQKGVEQAISIIEAEKKEQDKVLCICLTDCHESLAGIIAGRIRERYYRPTFIFTEVEDGLKGSGRSIESYNMYAGLVNCKDLLGRFGGHPMAAGLSLPKENFRELSRRLNEQCTLTEKDMTPIVRIDAAMPIHYLSEGLIESLELLEPFGKGNEKPLFAEQHFAIMKGSIIGKNRNVMKFYVLNRAGASIEALYFGDIPKLEQFLVEEYGKDQVDRMYRGQANDIDIAFTYYPSINEFRGTRTLQIVVQNYCRIK